MVEACFPYVIKVRLSYVVETAKGLDVTLDNPADGS